MLLRSAMAQAFRSPLWLARPAASLSVSQPLRFASQNVELPSRKEFILKAKSSMTNEELLKMYPDWDDQMKYRSQMLKKKRVLRRYMRLKRNNWVKTNKDMLTDEWHVENFLPKIQGILDDHTDLLDTHCESSEDKCSIEVSSYWPMKFELNVYPVMEAMIKNSKDKKYNLHHSLPVVEEKMEPLVFRRYDFGDELVKSEIFGLEEPSKDKKQVFPHVVIVPLMGFIEDCSRVGYGGGFYDRTILQLKEKYNDQVLFIGVGYEAQRYDSVGDSQDSQNEKLSKIQKMRQKLQSAPTMQWVNLETDQPVDYIVTDKKVYKREE